MNVSEHNSPFFQPVSRRIAIVVFVALWFAVEIYGGDSFWAIIAGGMLCYAVWIFFLSWPKSPDKPPQ